MVSSVMFNAPSEPSAAGMVMAAWLWLMPSSATASSAIVVVVFMVCLGFEVIGSELANG